MYVCTCVCVCVLVCDVYMCVYMGVYQSVCVCVCVISPLSVYYVYLGTFVYYACVRVGACTSLSVLQLYNRPNISDLNSVIEDSEL